LVFSFVFFRSVSAFSMVCSSGEALSSSDEQTIEKALTDAVTESLSSLKERESKILRLYFGLDGDEPMTLEEIGTRMGITRERVRQIKEKALSRLRHVSQARALESFLN